MSHLTNRRSVLARVGAQAAALAFVAVNVAGAASGTAAAAPETVGAGAGETLPVGAALPSAENCSERADVIGSGRETVPDNNTANHSVPEELTLPAWPD